MVKRASKKIIQEAVLAAVKGEVINELGLGDIPGVPFVKSVGAGIKGGVQTIGGNYRANRAKSYMDQYAKKTQKDVEKFGGKAKKQAQKMKTSKHPSVVQTGEKIEDEVEDTKERVKSVAQDIQQSFPSAVGGAPTKGMAARGEERTGGVLGGFYKWLQDEHGISRQDFLGLGKQAQLPYTEEYLKSVASKKMSAKKETELTARLQQEPSAETGGAPTPEMEKMMQKYPGIGGKPQTKVPSQPQQVELPQVPDTTPEIPAVQAPQTMTQPMVQPPRMTGAQAPPVSKPRLTATIGDMMKQKPLRLAGTDVLGIPPEVAKRMSKKELERRKRAAVGKQTPMKSVQKSAGSIPKTRQQPLDLPSVGATPEEFKVIDKAAREGHPSAVDMMKSMQWGDVEAARKHLTALRQSGFETPSTTKSLKKSKPQKATKNMKKAGKSTKALKKARIQMPPENQFKDIVGQAASSYLPPSPDQLKPQGYSPPSPDVLEPGVQPVPLEKKKGRKQPPKVRVASPEEEEQERRTQQRKRNMAGTEADEPIMTMADFMRRTEDDPEQVVKAKQKIDQERELQKRKPRKSRVKKGKRVLIQDKDKGARTNDKFVSPEERKQEGY